MTTKTPATPTDSPTEASPLSRKRRRAGLVLAAVAGVGLVGTLAGCSATADEETTSGSSGSSSSSSDAATDTSTGSATTDSTEAATSGSSEYADGTYSATGEYRTPGGQEEIDITITLADGVVTAVEAGSDTTNANSKQYQGEFADGIAAVVVGKNIDDLEVSKVAGSSLTSTGFNEAVEQIKTEAAA